MQSQLELQLRGGIASRELVLWSSDVLDSPNPLGCCGGFPSLSALSVIEFPTACCLIRPQRDKTPPPGCPNITNKQTMDNVDPPPAACRYEILFCIQTPKCFWVTTLLQC
jgi:hypothetical protein